MRCSLRLLAGALSLSLAASGCGDRKRGDSGHDAAHNVTYEVTGSGPNGSGLNGRVKVRYLARVDGSKAGKKFNSRQVSDYAPLPYTKDAALGDLWDRAHLYAGVSSTRDAQATLTCTIKHNGAVVATQTRARSVTCDVPKGSAAPEDN